MEKAAKGGFNINGANNGKLLKEGYEHFGNHRTYSTDVLRHLDNIPKNVTPAQAAQHLQDAADILRNAIDKKKYGPWG